MHNQRTYQLRQNILRTAADAYPGPFGMDDLGASQPVRNLRAERSEIVSELNTLARAGFLEPIPESNGDWLKISASGLDQINQETALDHRIWGKDAFGA